MSKLPKTFFKKKTTFLSDENSQLSNYHLVEYYDPLPVHRNLNDIFNLFPPFQTTLTLLSLKLIALVIFQVSFWGAYIR